MLSCRFLVNPNPASVNKPAGTFFFRKSSVKGRVDCNQNMVSCLSYLVNAREAGKVSIPSPGWPSALSLGSRPWNRHSAALENGEMNCDNNQPVCVSPGYVIVSKPRFTIVISYLCIFMLDIGHKTMIVCETCVTQLVTTGGRGRP